MHALYYILHLTQFCIMSTLSSHLWIHLILSGPSINYGTRSETYRPEETLRTNLHLSRRIRLCTPFRHLTLTASHPMFDPSIILHARFTLLPLHVYWWREILHPIQYPGGLHRVRTRSDRPLGLERGRIYTPPHSILGHGSPSSPGLWFRWCTALS